MKSILISLLLLITVAACQNGKKENNDADANTAESEIANYANYGAQLSPNDTYLVSTESLADLMKDRDSVNVKLTGEIEKTCKMKGCWMTIKTGDSSSMRVTFKDYEFFVPKEGMEGKTAIFNGKMTKSVTSVATLRHFAQDEGKSAEEIEAITEPKEEYSFVAEGVLIEGVESEESDELK